MTGGRLLETVHHCQQAALPGVALPQTREVLPPLFLPPLGSLRGPDLLQPAHRRLIGVALYPIDQLLCLAPVHLNDPVGMGVNGRVDHFLHPSLAQQDIDQGILIPCGASDLYQLAPVALRC